METYLADIDLSKEIKQTILSLIRQNKHIRVRAGGNSMAPFISSGSMVTLKPINFKDIRLGDVIAYGKEGDEIFTLHRVIKIRKNAKPPFIITKGDANDSANFPIYANYLYAKAIRIENQEKVIRRIPCGVIRRIPCGVICLDTFCQRIKNLIIAIFSYLSLFTRKR